jgi:hypothetical protein
MAGCPHCGGEVSGSFRFCPWCAMPLRRKLVEHFRAHPIDDGKSLRVSRYTLDGHVRFSVWSAAGVAEAAVSLADPEAARLAAFVQRSAPKPITRARLAAARVRALASRH